MKLTMRSSFSEISKLAFLANEFCTLSDRSACLSNSAISGLNSSATLKLGTMSSYDAQQRPLWSVRQISYSALAQLTTFFEKNTLEHVEDEMTRWGTLLNQTAHSHAVDDRE